MGPNDGAAPTVPDLPSSTGADPEKTSPAQPRSAGSSSERLAVRRRYGPMVQRWPLALCVAGGVAALVAVGADPNAAGAAAGQTWPAFVIVAGLLLIGLVAADDGLFAAAGQRLATAFPGGGLLFAGVAALVVAVTAVLNLDTSVAFLTPVVVHTSRRRRDDGVILVSACLLLSNAGSLLLPGSNLTNLIVLGSRPVSGGTFFVRMLLPWVAAGLVTAAVIAWAGRRTLRHRVEVDRVADRPVLGVGLAAIVLAVVLILTVPSPAPAVAAVGVLAAAIRVTQHRISLHRVIEVLGLPVLIGLFGLSVGLGALGRDFTAPARALSHLDPWATAGVGALATVLINNLPAASLLSARPPLHPLSLLIGLNVGPNLFVTGSLAWVLWYNSARASGARPDVARTVRIGLVAAPLSLVAAVGALLLVGHA